MNRVFVKITAADVKCYAREHREFLELEARNVEINSRNFPAAGSLNDWVAKTIATKNELEAGSIVANLQGAKLEGALDAFSNSSSAPVREQTYLFNDDDQSGTDAGVDKYKLIMSEMSKMYWNALDEKKVEAKQKREASFPLMQWDRPIEIQLKAAHRLFEVVRDFCALSTKKGNNPSGENGLPEDIISYAMQFDSRYRAAHKCLSNAQREVIEDYALNVKPGEGLSKDEAILYLVAGYDLNEPPGKAHQKKAAASFQDNFLQNDIAKNGPENWVKDIVSQGPLICEKYAAKVVAEKYQSDAERCI